MDNESDRDREKMNEGEEFRERARRDRGRIQDGEKKTILFAKTSVSDKNENWIACCTKRVQDGRYF